MSERDPHNPLSQPGRGLRCDECEDMIADALDGVLSPADAAAFARHQGECVSCAQMLKETQQGRAWMQYLAAEPELPADLLKKILARTSGVAEPGVGLGVAGPTQPLPARSSWQHWRMPAGLHGVRQLARHALEPRLMMTVAMAFFSIALTLNLTGINLSQIRAGDLQPSRLRATLTRQYYQTNEQVTRYYLNLRLVYEMEARVRELRRATETDPGPQSPASSPNGGNGGSPASRPQQPVRDGSGSPSSTLPKGELPAGGRTSAQSEALLPVKCERPSKQSKVRHEVFRALRSTTEDQAERSLV